MSKKVYYGGFFPVGKQIFDGRIIDIEELYRLHNKGVSIFCSRCKAILLIALSQEEAKRLKIHKGIFCSNNQNHVATLID